MLNQILNNKFRNQDLALLLLRLAGGGFMLTHGWSKLLKLLDGNFQFADPIGLGPAASLVLAVFAEVVCSILIIVGFKGRFASVFLIITMLVAAFIQHGGDPWRKQEFPLLYAFVFIAIFLMGTGKYGIDGRTSS